MLRLSPIGCLLLACLAGLPVAPRAAAEDGAETLGRQLRSPVQAERELAVRAAIARGGAARTWARAWVGARDVRVRTGGWAVLAHVGTAEDLRSGLRAMTDAQPAVAQAAADAVVRLAAVLPLGPEPWIPADALRPAQVRALTYVLAQRLESAPRGVAPMWLLKLGESVVPCLVRLLRHARFDTAPRATAIAALAAVGGDRARRGLSGLVPFLEQKDDRALWSVWWNALREVGPGRGLDAAHDLVVRLCLHENGWRRGDRPPGLDARRRPHFYRFIAECPPAEGIGVVQHFVSNQLARAASAGRWRLWPSLAPEVVRAHLILSEPDDESLEHDVLAARPAARRSWVKREEELGQVLVHVEPYKDRAGVQKGLVSLLKRSDLPQSVRAWALYLQGETSMKELRGLADELIDAGGGAATLAQRRLGAGLLDRLGAAAPERIDALLADVDPWMRALGLRWVAQASQDRYPAARRAGALRRARDDEEHGPFLLALELLGQRLRPKDRERLLALAVGGPRDLRGRAWAAIDGDLGGGDSAADDPFPAPSGHASLDRRLRAAALARRLWDQERR